MIYFYKNKLRIVISALPDPTTELDQLSAAVFAYTLDLGLFSKQQINRHNLKTLPKSIQNNMPQLAHFSTRSGRSPSSWPCSRGACEAVYVPEA